MTRSRVLVVDDEPGMVRAVERVLSPFHEVSGASCAADAVAAASAFAPDVILLDVRMPDVSGLDLIDRLRDGCPSADVIFMTGSVSQVDAVFVHAIRAKAFYFIQKPFDREVLLALVQRCVELRRASRENREHLRRLEDELQAARAFQRGLLPPLISSFPGLEVAARYVPTSELAGDFFDVAVAGDGSVVLLVADVAGHGAAAAMLTGVVKAAFDSTYTEAYAPLAVLRRIAEGLRGFDWNRFVTAGCARIDAARRSIEYVGAGHPPSILWSRERGPELLQSSGMLLTPAFPQGTWETSILPLRQGDRLLLYTDGITETWGAQGTFGLKRLLNLVRAYPGGGETFLEAILDAVRRHSGEAPLTDDLTLLTCAVGTTD